MSLNCLHYGVYGHLQQTCVAQRRNKTPLKSSEVLYFTYFFLGYALETIYLLNLVPSKYTLKAIVKVWIGQKPKMRNLHIWGCSTHALKWKTHVGGWSNQFIHHSGRMIKAIHRFMFLVETYEVIPKRTKFFHWSYKACRWWSLDQGYEKLIGFYLFQLCLGTCRGAYRHEIDWL